MTAKRIGELIPGIIARAHRTAILGQLIDTFEAPDERKQIVILLHEAGIISDQTAELMIDHYGLAAA